MIILKKDKTKKLFLLVCGLLIMLNCGNNYDNTSYDDVTVDDQLLIQDKLDFIVSVDYHIDSSIQRFFVVSDTSMDDAKRIIKEIIKLDVAEAITNISFFTERKYARYSDEFDLELDSNGTVTDSALDFIKKWSSDYYFGEYSFRDSIFIKYPGRNRYDTLHHYKFPGFN